VECALPAEIVEGLAAAAGLSLLNVPRNYGGQERGLLARIAIAAEFGRTIALPPRGATILRPEVSPILYHLEGELRERVLKHDHYRRIDRGAQTVLGARDSHEV
jgi:alkylation response protein AidB-like acyl-CoA dehydrogenase